MLANGSEPAPVDVEFFRTLMRRFASSVVVVSSAHAGQIGGMTATAVCSVCAEPPTILIVVNRSARSHVLITASRAFVVNVLSAAQETIAERFAEKLDDQFAGIDHEVSGADYVIRNAAAHLACRVTREMDVGTHTVFVARVVGGSAGDEVPLLYHSGKYSTLKEAG